MIDPERRRRGERLNSLTRTAGDTDMGRLLRMFWHPVAVAHKLPAGKTQPVRVLAEDLLLYRGRSGQPQLVGNRCAHRSTLLQTGWVEGDEIRCMYHGWKYDGTGQCTERPAERDASRPRVKISGYPVQEYGDLIFAYMGEGEPPSFDLVKKDVLERADGIILGRTETWKCNWFQTVENAMDGVHVSFVHHKGHVGEFGEAVKATIPELEYFETESGIRQIATRSADSVRVSDWTFPNNNHITMPGPTKDAPWIDVCTWKVPVDDESTMRFTIWSAPSTNPDVDARLMRYFESVAEYNASDHHDELFLDDKYPIEPLFELTSAQDYVAQVGQGTIVDRGVETLGRSDAGIALMRKIFLREMDALREGRPTKVWRKLDMAAEMSVQV